MLRRVRRLVCPACGKGRLFRRYFVRKDICGHCGWKFERSDGHWVGGSEVHMMASYGISMVVAVPVIIFVKPTPLLLSAVIGGHVLLSLLLFRLSRALFLGLDYMCDPAAPESPDDGFDDGIAELLQPPPPAGGANRRPRTARRVARSALPRV